MRNTLNDKREALFCFVNGNSPSATNTKNRNLLLHHLALKAGVTDKIQAKLNSKLEKNTYHLLRNRHKRKDHSNLAVQVFPVPQEDLFDRLFLWDQVILKAQECQFDSHLEVLWGIRSDSKNFTSALLQKVINI